MLEPELGESELVNQHMKQAISDTEDRLEKVWPGKVERISSLSSLESHAAEITAYLPPVGRNLDLVKTHENYLENRLDRQRVGQCFMAPRKKVAFSPSFLRKA